MSKKADSIATQKAARRTSALHSAEKRAAAAAAALHQQVTQLAQELEGQVEREEGRTGVRDQANIAYSSFAKMARARIENLRASGAYIKTLLKETPGETLSAKNPGGHAPHVPHLRYVRDAVGNPLTVADLPPADTTRWVIGRKAAVVAAVEGGLLSLPEALARYALSFAELCSWRAALQAHGVSSLRTTRVQEYR